MEIIQGPFDGNSLVLRWFWKKKHHPERQADALEQLMSEDLLRLAETSPHLLDDIGFRCDPGSSSPTREVWRRDGLGIAVVRRNANAEVRTEALQHTRTTPALQGNPSCPTFGRDPEPSIL